MFVFPTHRLNPSTVKPGIISRVVSGGVALSGEEDLVATDGGGRLKIDYSGIVLRTPDTLRLWNAWDGYLAGGVVACLVPLVSLVTAPRIYAGNAPRAAFAIGGDDPMFPETVAYQVRTISAETVGSAALRATTLTIDMLTGSLIKGGEWFSIGERGYRIVRVTARAGRQATCQIEPPLRAAVPDGTAVEFEWPVVKAAAMPSQDLALALTRKRAEQSISFVEVA